MDRLHDRLVEAGLINHWLNELFETAMKAARKAAAKQKEAAQKGEGEAGSTFLQKEVWMKIKEEEKREKIANFCNVK